jgi:hypothetical protein
MARTQALAGTCEAIIRVLRSSFVPAQFSNAPLDFQVYAADDFTHPMDEGISLFLYGIYPNNTRRIPSGRLLPNGQRQRSKLPVDLHFLLTAWAKKASLQHEIAGWMVRVMEDNPLLPASLLNAYRPDVFSVNEQVQVSLTNLSVEEMFRVWEVIIRHVYQLSVPYVATMVEIESDLTETLALEVQERVADLRQIEQP